MQRVSDERLLAALSGVEHVRDGTGGSANMPGYIDLARDLLDARRRRDMLHTLCIELCNVLEQCEFSSNSGEEYAPRCPACDALNEHDPDCALSDILTRARAVVCVVLEHEGVRRCSE